MILLSFCLKLFQYADLHRIAFVKLCPVNSVVPKIATKIIILASAIQQVATSRLAPATARLHRTGLGNIASLVFIHFQSHQQTLSSHAFLTLSHSFQLFLTLSYSFPVSFHLNTSPLWATSLWRAETRPQVSHDADLFSTAGPPP